MRLSSISCLILLAYFFVTGCSNSTEHSEPKLKVGAERSEIYLPLLEGKKVGLVVNQSSMVDSVHLINYLVRKGVDVKGIYAPEHGYKGNVERGKHVDGEIDAETGIPVYSLYGKNHKPSPEILKDIEVMVFDMQDVGVRFFTYIYTMTRVMEASAENGIKVVVLDRPNPNIEYHPLTSVRHSPSLRTLQQLTRELPELGIILFRFQNLALT